MISHYPWKWTHFVYTDGWQCNAFCTHHVSCTHIDRWLLLFTSISLQRNWVCVATAGVSVGGAVPVVTTDPLEVNSLCCRQVSWWISACCDYKPTWGGQSLLQAGQLVEQRLLWLQTHLRSTVSAAGVSVGGAAPVVTSDPLEVDCLCCRRVSWWSSACCDCRPTWGRLSQLQACQLVEQRLLWPQTHLRWTVSAAGKSVGGAAPVVTTDPLEVDSLCCRRVSWWSSACCDYRPTWGRLSQLQACQLVEQRLLWPQTHLRWTVSAAGRSVGGAAAVVTTDPLEVDSLCCRRVSWWSSACCDHRPTWGRQSQLQASQLVEQSLLWLQTHLRSTVSAAGRSVGGSAPVVTTDPLDVLRWTVSAAGVSVVGAAPVVTTGPLEIDSLCCGSCTCRLSGRVLRQAAPVGCLVRFIAGLHL